MNTRVGRELEGKGFSGAVTVTVWGVFQLAGLNVSVWGENDAPGEDGRETKTDPVGAWASRTVNVAGAPPSETVIAEADRTSRSSSALTRKIGAPIRPLNRGS